jgi:transposase
MSAISATARKLATILWNMLTKKEAYQPTTQYLFLDQKRKMKLVTRIKKEITKFNLTTQDLGIVTN